MRRKNYQPEDLIDTFALGLRFPWPGPQGPLLRNATIVAVCWDGETAQCVNAAGLAVPCKAGDLLPLQLSRACRKEFSTIIGDGQFSMKAHTIKSLESAGTLRKWVLYHFDMGDCFFYDDAAAWEAHEKRDISELLPVHFQEAAAVEAQLLRRQHFNSDQCMAAAHAPAALPTPEQLEARRQQAIAERQAELQEQRRRALEQDRELGAWLRGELPAPPLLRSVA